MKAALLSPLAALLLTGAAHAATPPDPKVIFEVFCAKAAVFAEGFAAGSDAGKSHQDSVVGAVSLVNSTFKKEVDAATLKLLLPWAGMTTKLPGYKPYTKGSYVASSCLALLGDSMYMDLQKAEVVSQVRSFLGSCEAKGTQDGVGSCFNSGFAALPLEKIKQ